MGEEGELSLEYQSSVSVHFVCESMCGGQGSMLGLFLVEHLTIFKNCMCGGGVGGRPLHMSEDDLRGQKKVLDPWEFALGL